MRATRNDAHAALRILWNIGCAAFAAQPVARMARSYRFSTHPDGAGL